MISLVSLILGVICVRDRLIDCHQGATTVSIFGAALK